MKKAVGFGDFLVRLNPEGYKRFLQADRFEAYYTGAEANVLSSLSMMGVETEFVTRLPENAIARCAVASLRKLGVGVSHIAWGGERMGVFYVEKGASQRPSTIVYDRKYTSIATAKPEDFDFASAFAGAGWFHCTGITPALGEHMPEVTEFAMAEARRMGLKVSCDLNYRKNLWTTQRAKQVMERLLPMVDILIANEEDCEKVLGIRAAETDVVQGKLSREGYMDVARQLTERFGVQAVGVTLRKSISASDNEWSAMLYTGGKAYFSRTYAMHIVDRVGGGDSFAAGLLYGFGNGFAPQKIIDYAAAASCLKHSIELDVNLSTVDEICRLMEGDGSGRVQR
ncbi:MAG: sugar kinase [Eubacteriales bacterium]|nr:sugar kinase [Eubacteriales bacterium]